MVVSICIISVPVTHGRKKKALNPLELELQKTMNLHVGTGHSLKKMNHLLIPCIFSYFQMLKQWFCFSACGHNSFVKPLYLKYLYYES